MNKPAYVPLETQRVLLRRFTDADLQPFLAYANDPLVARYQSWESHTEEEAKEIIAQQKELDPGDVGKWFTYATEFKAKHELIGHLALKLMDEQQAEIGFTLARSYQGQGLAFEATSRLLDFVFKDLRLHRVIAIADCENDKSIALLERLGMRREGHFIKNIWFKGKWGDEYLYALLRDEWIAQNERRDELTFSERSNA